MEKIRVPAAAPARVADELWRHTCFEAFTADQDGDTYHEFNFSPSGEWAGYAFQAYRARTGSPQTFDPRIAVRRTAHSLELDAVVPFVALPRVNALRLGLCAVVEDRQGGITYWALSHPPGKPDFHHRDAFALRLDLAKLSPSPTQAGEGEILRAEDV
jgi:hypothetical protein